MENNELKTVTLRIKQEQREAIWQTMKDTGCHTASKAIMQMICGYARLAETNRRLLNELETTRTEVRKLKADALLIRTSALELKKQLAICLANVDTAVAGLDNVDLEMDKERKPPKGWNRKE